MREGKPSGLAMHQRLLRERLVRCWQNGSWSLSQHSPPCCLYLELYLIFIYICVFVLDYYFGIGMFLSFIELFTLHICIWDRSSHGGNQPLLSSFVPFVSRNPLFFCLIVSVKNSIMKYSLSVKCFGFHCTCILSLCFDRSIAVHSPVQSVGGGRAQSSVPSKSSL